MISGESTKSFAIFRLLKMQSVLARETLSFRYGLRDLAIAVSTGLCYLLSAIPMLGTSISTSDEAHITRPPADLSHNNYHDLVRLQPKCL